MDISVFRNLKWKNISAQDILMPLEDQGFDAEFAFNFTADNDKNLAKTLNVMSYLHPVFVVPSESNNKYLCIGGQRTFQLLNKSIPNQKIRVGIIKLENVQIKDFIVYDKFLSLFPYAIKDPEASLYAWWSLGSAKSHISKSLKTSCKFWEDLFGISYAKLSKFTKGLNKGGRAR